MTIKDPTEKQLRLKCDHVSEHLEKEYDVKVEYYRIHEDDLVHFYSKSGLRARLKDKTLEVIDPGSNVIVDDILVEDIPIDELEKYEEVDDEKADEPQSDGSNKGAAALAVILPLAVLAAFVIMGPDYPNILSGTEFEEPPVEGPPADPPVDPGTLPVDAPGTDGVKSGIISSVIGGIIEVDGVQIAPALVDFQPGTGQESLVSHYCRRGHAIDYNEDSGRVPPGPVYAKIWCYGPHPSANGVLSVNEQLLALNGLTLLDSHCAGSEFGGERWVREAGCG